MGGVITVDSIQGFEGYVKYEQLKTIAMQGVQSHVLDNFVPNKGLVDLQRPQYDEYKRAIHHELAKLQATGKCILLPRELIMGAEGLHVNLLHVVVKPGDDKIRVCTDAAASGLNEGTNMDDVDSTLGDFNLPNTRFLAGLLDRATKAQKKVL